MVFMSSKGFSNLEQSHLKVFENMIEGSVDFGLVEEVEAREKLHGSSSRGFSNKFDIRVYGFTIEL